MLRWLWKENEALIPNTANQVTHQILSLFDLTKPTMPRAFNVLEGVTRGDILVDDLTNPRTAVVHEAVYGTLYFGGRLDVPPALVACPTVPPNRRGGNRLQARRSA